MIKSLDLLAHILSQDLCATAASAVTVQGHEEILRFILPLYGPQRHSDVCCVIFLCRLRRE